MNAPAFFDTNVLVYMHDPAAPFKRQVARDLFLRHRAARTIVLSTQVLQEFHVAVMRRLPALPIREIRSLVSNLARLRIVTIQPAHILDAISVQASLKLSFWDSLILRSAKEAGAAILLTEDLSHGRIYDGVEVRNPFMVH